VLCRAVRSRRAAAPPSLPPLGAVGREGDAASLVIPGANLTIDAVVFLANAVETEGGSAQAPKLEEVIRERGDRAWL
jgi:hypothetical protein